MVKGKPIKNIDDQTQSFFKTNKNIILKAVERQFGKKQEALVTLSLKLSVGLKALDDFLMGKKTLHPEKLCELLDLISLPSTKKSRIINSNLVIDIINSHRPELAPTILELITKTKSSTQVGPLSTTQSENFSLTLFYIASVLPHLEGDIKKIAEFLSIDISKANEMYKILERTGVLTKAEMGQIKAKYSWMYLEKLIKGELKPKAELSSPLN